MSRHSKGKQRERELRKIFEQDGFLTDFKPSNRYVSDDLFEMFDFVAIRSDAVEFVQVKSNMSDFYTARKKMQKWLKANNLLIQAFIWVRPNRKLWRASHITQCDILESSTEWANEQLRLMRKSNKC